MKRLLAGILFVLVTVPAVAAPPPDQIVKDNVNRLIELLKANRDTYARDHKKLYAMVHEQVLPHFDFRVMSRSVLGRYWREASDEQRDRFVNEFRDLLVRTYATALLKYTNEEVRYLPFRFNANDKTAVVKTEVVQQGGPAIPIQYSFYQTESGWKVYDVTIEGISLVTNYRTTYANKVKTDGLDALIASMADANRRGQVDVKAPGSSAGSGK